MKPDLSHFEEFNEQIFQVYKEKNLKNLGELNFNGQSQGSAAFMSGVLRKKIPFYPLPYSVFKIHDELDFITKDIKYITGVLYFLRPFIVDTAVSGGTYSQNLADRRYLMYANFGLQSIYNFWDRIGDLLHHYFETRHKSDQVYFNRMIRDIKEPHRSTEAFKELETIYKNDISPINDDRSEAVHHFQLENKYYWGNIETYEDLVERDKVNNEKHNLPEKFQHHLELCFQGFELAIELIDHLPDKVFISIRKEIMDQNDVPGKFRIKELEIIDEQRNLIDQVDPDKYYTEQELKGELAGKLGVAEGLIVLINPFLH